MEIDLDFSYHIQIVLSLSNNKIDFWEVPQTYILCKHVLSSCDIFFCYFC